MSVITLSINDSTRGSVTGGGTYDVGSQVTVTATSNSGYLFACWSNGSRVVSSNPSYTFSVEGDITLTAIFYSDVDSIRIYGLCEANCKYRVLNIGQIISLIQEMAANGWQVPTNYIPATAVNEIVDQNTGLPMKWFIGTQKEYDNWTGDKEHTLYIPIDDTTVLELENAIESVSREVEKLQNGIENGTVVAKNATYAQYASEDTSKGTIEARLTKEETILNGYDTSKGTVEQRLTRLGFSEGVVSFPSEISGATVDVNFIRRQGKYVYGKVELSNMSVVVNHGKILFTIPEGFRISATAQSRINEVYGYTTYKTLGSGMAIGLYFHTDGTAMVSTAYSSSYALTNMCVVFGYEID